MEHMKHLRYQIRITNNITGEKECYPIDWGISIYTLKDGTEVLSFTQANEVPGTIVISSDVKIEIGFFEDES